jgi:hypothetical protein
VEDTRGQRIRPKKNQKKKSNVVFDEALTELEKEQKKKKDVQTMEKKRHN